MGVLVGVGVTDGVINDTIVGEGSNVKVGTRVIVGVSVIAGTVEVHVAGGWIGVIVGVGGWLGSPGAKGLMAELGIKYIATKYKPIHSVNSSVRMLKKSHTLRREPRDWDSG